MWWWPSKFLKLILQHIFWLFDFSHFKGVAIENVSDSSRYFVIRVVDDNGKYINLIWNCSFHWNDWMKENTNELTNERMKIVWTKRNETTRNKTKQLNYFNAMHLNVRLFYQFEGQLSRWTDHHYFISIVWMQALISHIIKMINGLLDVLETILHFSRGKTNGLLITWMSRMKTPTKSMLF